MAMRQWYQEPQAWRWYYHDPTRPFPSSSPATLTDAMLEPITASLKSLQSQFTAFQEGLCGVKSDVKDALSQLRALRTAQSRTDRSVAELEGVIGVSSTSTQDKGSTKRTKGSKTTDAPHETLVQIVASIQSAIDALGRSSHVVSGLPSTVDSSPTTMQFTFPVSSLSHSESSSPITPEFGTSPSPVPPPKEYVEASIQAYPTPASEPLCSLSKPHGNAPGFIPVDWNSNPSALGRFASNPYNLLPANQNAETPSAAVCSSVVQPQLGRLGGSQMSHTSSLGSLRSTQDTHMLPSATNISSQNPEQPLALSVTVTGVGSAIALIPSHTESSGVSHASSTSPTSPVSNTPVSGAVDTTAKTLRESTTSSSNSRQSPLRDADDEGLPSGLPTPPSEHDPEPTLVSRSTREVDSRLMLRTHLSTSGGISIIPTPPFWTSEPAVGEGRGIVSVSEIGQGPARQGSVGASEPLTPPLFSPSEVLGSSPVEKSARNSNEQIGDHEVVEADSPRTVDNANKAAKGVDAAGCVTPVITVTDVSQTTMLSEDATHVLDVPGGVGTFGTPTSSVNQVNTVIGQPTHDVDQTYSPPRAYDTGYDFHFSSPCLPALGSPPMSAMPSRYATPSESSDARQTHAQDEDEVWDALMLQGQSGVSTPLSGASALEMLFSHPTSRAVSVPAEDVHADVNVRTVDPSVLQLHLPNSSVQGRSGASRRMLDGSLSPLTSLDDASDVGKETVMDDSAATTRVEETPRTHLSSEFTSGGHITSHTDANCRVRHSEPYTIPPSRALDPCMSGRAASEATGMAGHVGGPSASLEELAMLARKAPLKILLRLPRGMRGLKRKRDVDGDGDGGHVGHQGEGADGSGDVAEGVGVTREGEVTNGKRGGLRVVTVGEGGRGDGVDGPGEVAPPAQTGVETSTLGLAHTPTTSRVTLESSIHSGLVGDGEEQADIVSHLPGSRKSTKHENRRSHKKRRRERKTNSGAAVTWHVRKGQVVHVASEEEPQPSPPSAPPSAPQPEKDGLSAQAHSPTCSRHDKNAENPAMKTPPSSPAHGSQRRRARSVKSSPSKEDVWGAIARRASTWPELPSSFSHWDVQFIQCDNCDKWYHYGCVAVQSGDPRLEPSALFICPTCHNQSARRQTLRHQGDTCARPDCPEPQVTSESEVFFIEKLVGRKKCEGYVYLWLAKWEGYPMTQATWIPKENVVGDGTRMMNTFLEEAAEEGADVSQVVVLLQEARDAGWDALTR